MSREYGFSAQGSHRHVVQFYDRDEDLAENVGNYLAGALSASGAAVIVATPAHCAGFEARLAADGVDVAAARQDGTLVCVDAVHVAGRLTRAGRIDPPVFDLHLRPAILAAGEAPGPVRIYGEAVALLWAAGQVNAALELEERWNELGREIPFSLYCGYPRQLVESSQHEGAVAEVCRLHTSVVGAPGGLADPARPVTVTSPAALAHWGEASRTFAGTLNEPRAARAFVLGMLEPWRGERLFMDSALVVTELATNAVRHARSAFRVSLVLSGDTIRISVDDTLPLSPPGEDLGLPARRGHGLGLIAAMAARWGVERLPSGKSIWAELRLPDNTGR